MARTSGFRRRSTEMNRIRKKGRTYEQRIGRQLQRNLSRGYKIYQQPPLTSGMRPDVVVEDRRGRRSIIEAKNYNSKRKIGKHIVKRVKRYMEETNSYEGIIASPHGRCTKGASAAARKK